MEKNIFHFKPFLLSDMKLSLNTYYKNVQVINLQLRPCTCISKKYITELLTVYENMTDFNFGTNFFAIIQYLNLGL